MKKTLLIIGGAILLCQSGVFAQKCGMQILHETMIAKDPSWAQKLEAQRASLQGIADNYILQQSTGALNKTTTVSAVPIIFHIIVDSAQFVNLGGTAGIIKRCDSQIAVLNRDFNKQNSDSTLIPSGWKSLYGNSGIHFGLARKDPGGVCSPGYEVKIIAGTSLTTVGFSNMNQAFPEAKATGTGLLAWDITKYYNVWCINFTGSASSLLGITVPLSNGASGQVGVCILYNSLGKTTSGAGSFPASYNLGRTLTHETGHFFEIWHPWGDDGGLCPWPSSGGYDDGLSDTPPESDAVYGNPAYTITGGTYNDGCKMNGATNTQPIGIACLSFMDYTNDNAMHLFTTMQAATMAAQVAVGGENYSLTQNPNLLLCPTSVAATEVNSDLNIYPNPTTGQLTISFNSSVETLKDIVVINLVGQQVMTVNGQGKDYYSLDLSGMSKGLYFVKCNFASGSVTRKILLQ